MGDKAALPVQNVEEDSIIVKFANFLPGFFHSNTRYIRLSDMQINRRFFPLKLNKWFGVLQEYSIINNILLYDIRIGGVDCTRFRFPARP